MTANTANSQNTHTAEIDETKTPVKSKLSLGKKVLIGAGAIALVGAVAYAYARSGGAETAAEAVGDAVNALAGAAR